MSKIHIVVIDNRDYGDGEVTNLVAFNDEESATNLVSFLETTASKFRKDIKKKSRKMHQIRIDDPDYMIKFNENRDLYTYNDTVVKEIYADINFPDGVNVSVGDLKDDNVSFYLETLELI